MDESTAIAVVGLAVRLPGAPDAERFWDNLAGGVDSVTRFTEAAARAAGAPVDTPGFVAARAVLDDPDCFDAAFFQISPAAARAIDPQHRIFLELCWAALEDAAIEPARFDAPIGVFGGCSVNTYLVQALRQGADWSDDLAALTAADKDHLATRVSYRLGLTGPGITVQSACSTSLVAVHLACQSLLAYECDAALAGGVSLTVPWVGGYVHRPGDVYSSDGRTRSFDADADGACGGDGAGVVVLRRLEDARAAGDPVRAIILGTAVNNDGARKLGYTAPSVDGQAAVVAAAQALADVSPRTVGYVEAHGTATPLGDPVEVAALTQAFRAVEAEGVGWCGLGSVKSNLGHLNCAAGVAGLVKAVLALEHGVIPPSLHFANPNPALSLDTSPFYVPTTPTPWPGDGPRRAGVSSFGAGGTNAHVVLQAAPPPPPASGAAGLLPVSARTPAALDAATTRLTAWVARHGASLDVAHTLSVGRRAFAHRRVLRAGEVVHTGQRDPEAGVVYVFPGQGVQRKGMGRALYGSEPVFRDAIDRCAAYVGADLTKLMWGEGELDDQRGAGPALFAHGYGLAALWGARGLPPDAVVGQSTGEYVAACVAGVMSLEDALRLFVARAELMARCPPGAALHVPLPAAAVELDEDQWIALHNGPRATVVTGTVPAIDRLEARLAHLRTRRLPVSVPAHTPLLAPVADALLEVARSVHLRAPKLPLVSGVTGAALSADEARDPAHWVRHLLQPVRFSDALATACAGRPLAVEMGPPGSVAPLVAYNLPAQRVLTGALDADDARGALWCEGRATLPPSGGRRVSLPTYPFERQRHWIDHTGPGARPARPPRPALATAYVAPSTEAERVVVAICEDLLGMSGVGVTDPLFALGGDSLITLRIVEEVRRRTGRELPPEAAFTGLTPGRMASYLGEVGAARGDGHPPSLVPIRPEGTEPPLFMVHPAAGVVFPYFELARRLGATQPFYGLQAHGLDGRTAPDHRVEDMAEHYLEGVRAVQASGPYRLAGFSFGAYVAYEMARRLDADGETVERLLLVDEPAPRDGYRPNVVDVGRLWLGGAGRSFLDHLHDYMWLRRGESAAGRMRAFLQRSAMAGLIPDDARGLALDQAAMGPLAKLLFVHLRETFRYRPPPWPTGRALLLKSDWSATRPRLRRDPDETMGWSALIGEVQVRRIPGNHLSVLRDPHVGVLAAEVERYLGA